MARGFLFASPRRVDGGLVQAVVTPPAPSFPLYDDEVQGEFLWWVFLVGFDGSSIGRFILFYWYFEPQFV